MTQNEMVEIVKQHHPGMGEVEIRKLLNRAQDDFTYETDILESTFSDTTILNKIYYTVHPDMLKLRRVVINDDAGVAKEAIRVIGVPFNDNYNG